MIVDMVASTISVVAVIVPVSAMIAVAMKPPPA
jgi:hypothetical protein